MKADRETFGPRLRVERERRGISLKNIAESTKIKESLFVELERSDFSKWPQGIFRRAHLCAYVSAIGLPAQPILAEYLRLFPEECSVDRSEELQGTDAAGVCHADQDLKSRQVAPPRVDPIWIVSFDLAAVCLMSSIVAAIGGLSLWTAIAVVALAYSAIGSACFAQSIGSYAQRRIEAIIQTRGRPQTTVTTPLRDVQRIAAQAPRHNPSQGGTEREREVDARRASA